MLKKIILPTIFGILAYGFWVSPDLKEIAAGVAIFLFGMLFLEEGFKAYTGGMLEGLLRRTTDRLWKSFTLGVVSTTLMQSSSLVSVITISFLSAGLIGLAEGVGIIFGANLGTTTGAWLVAGLGLKVNISAYAMPMLAFGIILVMQRSRPLKGAGYILAGLGFLFLGIHYMKEGFDTFKASIDLAAYNVPGLAGLLLFTLVGALATVIMQSSHATLVLTITALAAQQVSYENALALAIGANVGTTITAILGAMSANVQGKRLAGAHLVFNMTTGIIAIVFIAQFMHAVDALSAAVGIAAEDYTLKLAVFHTLFNLVGIVVMLPLTGRLVAFLERAFVESKVGVSEPRYLNEAVMEIPDAALQAVRNETRHLFENAFDVIAHALNLSPKALRTDRDVRTLVDEPRRVEKIEIDQQYERRIKSLYGAIVAFVSRIPASTIQAHREELYRLRQASRDIAEAVKDIKHLQKNLVRFLVSPNHQIRAQYNLLRLNLATVLQQIAMLPMQDQDPDMLVLSLDSVAADLQASDVLANGVLDTLIREEAISPDMATSLMNDSTYVSNVASNLLSMARVVYASSGTELQDLEQHISLDEREIQEVVGSIPPATGAGKEKA